MGAAVRRLGSREDLAKVPDHEVGELVEGELFVSPRPRSRHALAATALASELSGPFQRGKGGPGGWWLLLEPELHLGENVLVPDLAAWRRERLPEFPDTAAFTLAPDWVCELLSPSTARLDLTLKLPTYARAGVAHAWIIDPANRSLQVFRKQDHLWVMASAHSEDALVRAEPFDAIELQLTALWGG
jgi:Uma2 family endonuclease